MFYTKLDHETGTIETVIHPENTYTLCPQCGNEHQIDLTDIPELCLESTQVYCSKCSAQREREQRCKQAESTEPTVGIFHLTSRPRTSPKIIQIIPAPANMLAHYKATNAKPGEWRQVNGQPVAANMPIACLALIELASGDREVRAMTSCNEGYFELADEREDFLFVTDN